LIVTRISATAEIYCQNLDSLGYIFVTDSMGLASVNLLQLAPKADILCEIMRNDGHCVVQSHWFWYRLKACMRVPNSE